MIEANGLINGNSTATLNGGYDVSSTQRFLYNSQSGEIT